ncbi:molybdopterin/thiamine biosynthesis adenylyltransferase [Neisseria perflava]|uniref:HesA/MoeB/ThiF family protein n=1 Tax=Neisseria perflava TaxID=33053 RepID=UPI00209F4873|nr:HesA/MoeB/ThiF family protein [Neisseria perflava]MCP1771417.1 molybdopterin/thiamine biosynthesis adenylyltransferase [Neisseria perflava]
MNDQQLLRYSRHILLDEIGIEGQQRLLDVHAVVVGCGGLGAAALPYLAAAGVGRLTVADDDTIDETNLQRQIIYTEADLGRAKAEVMAGRLNTLNSQTHITALTERLDEARLTALLREADIVLDCCDNFATRQAVNRAAVATQTPLVSGAAVRFEGQLAVYRPGLAGSPCYACLFDGDSADDGACALFGVFSPLVGIIGSSQAAEALKVLMDIGTPAHGLLRTYDALSGEWQAFEFAKNPACRVCGAG